jgi:uncharacterized membrane protein YgcG
MKFRLLMGLAVLTAGLFTTSGLAAADVNDFTVNNFQSDQSLTQLDRQGQLHIVERLNVTFTDFNHGILRAIPQSYKGHSLQLHINQVTSESGAPTKFSTYGSNDNTVLKIGDPNRTVTGAQQYTIDYTISNVISFYNDHDELYWDVNGDQWQQPFEHVTATVHLPETVKMTSQPICFSGSYQSNAQNCTITRTADGFKVETTEALAANQTLTYVAAFPKGAFQPSTLIDSLSEHSRSITEVAIPVIILGGGSLLLWFRGGRDARGGGIIIPQYDAPDGLSPMAVGTLSDFKLDNRDITATIIKLAVDKRIKIIESKQDKLLGKDTLNYTLQLTNPDFSKLDSYEAVLMAALFPAPQQDALVNVTAEKNKLYKTATSLKKTVESDLTNDGYFKSNPLTAGKVLIGFLSAVVIFLYFAWGALDAPLVIGLGISLAIMAIAAHFMSARTAKGVAAKEHIQGLKLYLDVAEKDRLQKLQGPNAQYAANAGEPVKTVELFEKLLPYAIVLGVEKEWAKQFEGLYTSPPDWYAGNWTAFNVGYLAGSLGDGLNSTMNSAFSAPSSSGSSGFGGGGFSGGGGGGGGGGGW